MCQRKRPTRSKEPQTDGGQLRLDRLGLDKHILQRNAKTLICEQWVEKGYPSHHG